MVENLFPKRSSLETECMRNGIWHEREVLDRALELGQISESIWHDRLFALIRKLYLAESTPWGQSGNSGNWRQAKISITSAFDRDGSFLDCGCANGYLMESVYEWMMEKGVVIEPYGVDAVSELVDIGVARLPEWRSRFWVGNIRHWTPGRKFDFVRVSLDFCPPLAVFRC